MIRRRRTGLERVGVRSLQGGRWPDGLERRLELTIAWRAIAGAALASRARALGIRRGVLELEIVEEVRWEAVLEEVVPALAARLAEAHPAFGLKRYRVRRASDRTTPKSQELPRTVSGSKPIHLPETLPAEPEDQDISDTAESLDERLRKASLAYLRRGGSAIDGKQG